MTDEKQPRRHSKEVRENIRKSAKAFARKNLDKLVARGNALRNFNRRKR